RGRRPRAGALDVPRRPDVRELDRRARAERADGASDDQFRVAGRARRRTFERRAFRDSVADYPKIETSSAIAMPRAATVAITTATPAMTNSGVSGASRRATSRSVSSRLSRVLIGHGLPRSSRL